MRRAASDFVTPRLFCQENRAVFTWPARFSDSDRVTRAGMFLRPPVPGGERKPHGPLPGAPMGRRLVLPASGEHRVSEPPAEQQDAPAGSR